MKSNLQEVMVLHRVIHTLHYDVGIPDHSIFSHQLQLKFNLLLIFLSFIVDISE